MLIIDDNAALAENIAEILQIDGHFTEVATSAEQALPMALANRPDVVVSDFRLPGVSGAAFIKSLGVRMHVHAIVISAYNDEGTIKAATDAGATFMAKPLDFTILSQFVRAGSA